MAANSRMIRQMNHRALWSAMLQYQKATKPELSQYTGLSQATVNHLIAEMEQRGEVIDLGEVPSNGGRPSRQYGFHASLSKAGILFGHRKNNEHFLHALVIDLNGTPLFQKKQGFSEIHPDTLYPWMDEMKAKHPEISLFSFGLPGEEENGEIVINDYQELVGISFLEKVRQRYRCEVLFENDVNAAVTGFACENPTSASVAALYFPRQFGPGAGLLLNGRLHRGKNHFAGEMYAIPEANDMKNLDFQNTEKVVRQVGQIIAVYCSVIAPDSFVLYGDFWTPEIKTGISVYIQEVLRGKFQPNLQFIEKIEPDFCRGMIELSLQQIRAPFLKNL